MDKKIAITGIGVLSPIGIGREEFWFGLRNGRTGFKDITLFDTSPFAVKIAGEISDFNPEVFLGKKGLRELDRSTKLLCSAAKLALDDAHLAITAENSDRVGVSIGATFGSLHSISQFDRVGLTEGPRCVNPSHFPNTVINSPASQVSIRFGIKGFNTTISNGFCAGLDSLIYACDFVSLGRAEVVLAGAVEEICEETFTGFYRLGCLSGIDGQEPACRPFDARRNGTILSEAAVILVLEDLEHALARDVNILATIQGFGTGFAPPREYGLTYNSQGLRHAIKKALHAAAVEPRSISYISSCANATHQLDHIEAEVISDIFGPNVPVSAHKSMTGETLSASGSLSAAAAVGALCNGFIPPTLNCIEMDQGCPIDNIVTSVMEANVDKVLLLSTDPYGQSSAVVIGQKGNVSC